MLSFLLYFDRETVVCTSSHDNDLAGKVGNVLLGLKRFAAEEAEHIEWYSVSLFLIRLRFAVSIESFVGFSS